MAWLYLRDRYGQFSDSTHRVLHIAPERHLVGVLRSKPGVHYVSGDLSYGPGRAVRFDLTALPFGDESFDVVYCSHVLEHVPDDALAMREIRRVLAHGGKAIVMVPLKGNNTYEDWTLTTRPAREKARTQLFAAAAREG